MRMLLACLRLCRLQIVHVHLGWLARPLALILIAGCTPMAPVIRPDSLVILTGSRHATRIEIGDASDVNMFLNAIERSKTSSMELVVLRPVDGESAQAGTLGKVQSVESSAMVIVYPKWKVPMNEPSGWNTAWEVDPKSGLFRKLSKRAGSTFEISDVDKAEVRRILTKQSQ